MYNIICLHDLRHHLKILKLDLGTLVHHFFMLTLVYHYPLQIN